MQEPVDDGLAIPEVGPWAKRKYHFLGRYLNAFTTAMKDKKWGGLHYIDLFCGAGIARIRGSGELVWSSAMLAAQVRFPFTHLHLCDADHANVVAIETRLQRRGSSVPRTTVTGDANSNIERLTRTIPKKALCVAFVDPYGLHFDFETAKVLSQRVRADLIVLLADNMDALRNWRAYYDRNPQSGLDRFLGTPDWRDAFKILPEDRHAQTLRELYQNQLKTLGYRDFEFETVRNSSDRDIYKLLYASRVEAGAKIWRGISAVDEGGQRRLGFME